MEYDKYRLADGRTVVFDELRERDLPKLIEVYNRVIEEGRYFHRDEGLPSLEVAHEWYQRHVKAGFFYLAARVNGELIGGATIEPGLGRASHVVFFWNLRKTAVSKLGRRNSPLEENSQNS